LLDESGLPVSDVKLGDCEVWSGRPFDRDGVWPSRNSSVYGWSCDERVSAFNKSVPDHQVDRAAFRVADCGGRVKRATARAATVAAPRAVLKVDAA
jgi:hypothetical protein